MDSIFGIIGVCGGLYSLYALYMMKTQKKLDTNVMLPKGIDASKCKDIDAYIKRTSIPLLILSIVLLLYGVIELINVHVSPIGKGIYIVLIVVLSTLFWFTYIIKKCNKEYFGV